MCDLDLGKAIFSSPAKNDLETRLGVHVYISFKYQPVYRQNVTAEVSVLLEANDTAAFLAVRMDKGGSSLSHWSFPLAGL